MLGLMGFLLLVIISINPRHPNADRRDKAYLSRKGLGKAIKLSLRG